MPSGGTSRKAEERSVAPAAPAGGARTASAADVPRWTKLVPWQGWAGRWAVWLLVGWGVVRGLHDKDFSFTDEPRHAINGTFVLDFVREGGWRDPIRFGEQYYARYPCLTLPYNYPPLFYGWEALWFALGGVSSAVARLSVMSLHVGAAWLLYELVRSRQGVAPAVLAALLFGLCPWGLKTAWWVVLEPPTVFAMFAATHLLFWYEARPSWGRGLCWLMGLACCLLTKQTGVLIVPVHALYLISGPGRATWQWPGMRWFAGLFLLALVGYVGLLVTQSLYQMRALTSGGWLDRMSWEHLSFYPGWLYGRLLGKVFFWLALAGIVGAASWWRAETSLRLHLWWVLSFFLLMAVLNTRTPRYAYLVFPPLAALAGVLLWRCAESVHRWAGGKAVGLAAALALIGVTGVFFGRDVLATQPRQIRGYFEAAREVAGRAGGSSVLVDAAGDGDFVFACRMYDHERRPVLRASKLLFTYASYKDVGYEEFVESEEEILELLNRYGTRYIVVEDVNAEHALAGELLRNLLQRPIFRRFRRIQLSDTRGFVEAEYLDLYEYLEARDVAGGELELHFPGLNRTIHTPLPGAKRTLSSETAP